MDRMPPPKPRQPSRFAPNRGEETLFRNSDLMGPLSTIPDGLQVTPENSTMSMEAARMPKGRETDAGMLAEWDDFYDSMEDIKVPSRNATFRVYIAGSGGPTLLCLHGGGYTGLTWAPLAKRVKESCQVVAIDQRGHGETSTSNDTDLAAETLQEDILAVWETRFGSEAAGVVIVGHSMGGAVAARIAATQRLKGLEGLVVIDVVEGTALAALPLMHKVIQNRPPSFPSIATAQAWAQSSGTCKSSEAASISLPSQLRKELAVTRERYVWRTDLASSAPFWKGWYLGLSELFLTVKAPKILMLAGSDRLDKVLTIGQMQGKFQMSLLPQAGHAVHEDEADRAAEILLDFLKRFRIGQAHSMRGVP